MCGGRTERESKRKFFKEINFYSLSAAATAASFISFMLTANAEKFFTLICSGRLKVSVESADIRSQSVYICNSVPSLSSSLSHVVIIFIKYAAHIFKALNFVVLNE